MIDWRNMCVIWQVDPGSSVLLVGGKGGYIGSLVAQMVGINGRVTTVSSKRAILDICRQRVEAAASPLSEVMEWIHLGDLSPQCILDKFGRVETFHAIIYCGSVAVLPEDLGCLLLNGGGALIAPVALDGGRQQFQMLVDNGGKGGQQQHRRKEIRKITEFGVIFEAAK